jgi:hypothetical protein
MAFAASGRANRRLLGTECVLFLYLALRVAQNVATILVVVIELNCWSYQHLKAASKLAYLENQMITKEDQMRRNEKTIASPDISDTTINLALVLGLFGVLAGIGSSDWAVTSTLFILAAVAGVGGLVIRYTNRDSRKLDKYDENAAVKAPVAELVGPLRAAGSSESTPGAGFNVNQFYRYPMNRVAAIFADLSGVKAALPQLEQAGFDLTGVNVLSGREGARLLDLDGAGHGVWARVLRVLQRGGAFEGETLKFHESALRNDQAIVFVPVRNNSEEQHAARILHQYGGRAMFRFHRWTIEPLPGIQLSAPN